MKTAYWIIILSVAFIVGVAGAYIISTQLPNTPTTYTCPICGEEVTNITEHLANVHGIQHMTP